MGALTLIGNVNDIATTTELLNDIVVFGFSFLILISVWLRYTKIMSVLRLENRWVVSLNTALLFTVSLEPFLFNVLQLDKVLSQESSSQAYAVDLGIMMAILGAFSLVVANDDRKLIPKDVIREFKIESATLFLAGAVFLISTLPIFWTPVPNGLYLRFYLWIIPFALSSIRRRTASIYVGIKKARDKSAPAGTT